MATATARLKRRLKFAPKMGRELRTEFLRREISADPRALSPAAIVKIRAELWRLAKSTTPAVRRFVSAMRRRYPEMTA